jgi:hypothetical protein
MPTLEDDLTQQLEQRIRAFDEAAELLKTSPGAENAAAFDRAAWALAWWIRYQHKAGRIRYTDPDKGKAR